MKTLSISLILILFTHNGYCLKTQPLCPNGNTLCAQNYLGNKIIADCQYSQIMSDDTPPQPTNFYSTDCTLKYSNAAGQTKQFKTNVDMEKNATLIWYDKRYAEIQADATGLRSNSIIFNFNNMTHTPIIQNLFALDSKRNLIAVNGEYIKDNKVANLQKILITGLYNHSKGMLVSFPSDADVSMVIDPSQSKFDQYGNLSLNYSTIDFEMKTITIPIIPSQFVILDPKMIETLGLNFGNS